MLDNMNKISEIQLFRAFRSRNYSLYFFGRSVSQFGTWMQRTAVVWVVYSITHSVFLVGATLFAETFPSFLFSIPGGVAADRYSRYRVITIMQVLSMVQSALLATLVYTGHTMLWAILALSVILGIINAFDVPARQSLLHEVVADPADLPNAISLTSAMASLAQLVGPALSGIVLSAFGAPVCFLINAASFGGVLLSIFFMKIPAFVPRKRDKKVIADFADGLKYLKETPELLTLILMLAIVSLLVMPYNTVLPVFAKVIFKGDAATFGYITSFIGVGAVTGTMFLASRKPGAGLRKILLVSTVVMSAGLICFSQLRSFPMAMFCAVLIGLGSMTMFSACNIIVQSESAAPMRGRVIGLLLMALFGMMPLGSLLVGAVAEHIGAPATVLWQGITGLVIALCFMKYMTGGMTKPVVKDVEMLETEEEIEERYADTF